MSSAVELAPLIGVAVACSALRGQPAHASTGRSKGLCCPVQ